MISTVILTRDEELHIARAVESVVPLGPVHVVDAGSTDRTVDLAVAAGAEVVTRSWRGYSDQRNWALQHLELGEWTLFLDADEYLTAQNAASLLASVQKTAVAGFYVNRHNYFLGQAIPHAGRWPDQQLRLFRTKQVRYEDRNVHEHPLVTGHVRNSGVSLEHDNLKGAREMLLKHLDYAFLEAPLARESGNVKGAAELSRKLRVRRLIKQYIWFKLPLRPLVRYAWILLVHRGYRDGRPGLAYAALLLAYEAMIDVASAEHDLLSSIDFLPGSNRTSSGPDPIHPNITARLSPENAARRENTAQ